MYILRVNDIHVHVHVRTYVHTAHGLDGKCNDNTVVAMSHCFSDDGGPEGEEMCGGESENECSETEKHF